LRNVPSVVSGRQNTGRIRRGNKSKGFGRFQKLCKIKEKRK
jgi:hypothetical protein